MVKKIVIDDEVISEKATNRKGRGHHSFSEFEEKFTRFQEEPFKKNVRRYGPKIVETRLFTNKDKLVEYVNEKGRSDAVIDIYKIEDELYKLVIKR